MSKEVWTIEDHLEGKPEASVALYLKFEDIVLGLGAVSTSVSKTTITFKGPRRGFAGGKPVRVGIRGYFDIMRNLGTDDRRIRAVYPYEKRLFVHQFVLETPEDLDDEFIGWLHEAYEVGSGEHLKRDL